MQSPRFASLLAFAAILPTSVFADVNGVEAGRTTQPVNSLNASSTTAGANANKFVEITAVNGQAKVVVKGVIIPLQVGTRIEVGSVVETDSGSTAELTFAGGVKVVLASSTRLSLRQLNSSSGFFACEVVLLRGSIAGDASGVSSSSNFSILTTSGVASVAGTSFCVGFTPTSPSNGTLNVLSLKGVVTVQPVASTGLISVPANFLALVLSSGSQVNAATPESLTNASDLLAGNWKPAPGQVVVISTVASPQSINKTNSNTFDGSIIFIISPYGSGVLQ